MKNWKATSNASALSAGEKLLSIEVTTCCNLNCLHCFVHAKTAEPCFLSPAVVQDILREGFDRGYRRLHLTGGEPLLWKGLIDTLGYAMSLGYISILINTNGTVLSKDMCAAIGVYDKVFVSVSLDGSEKCHERLRGYGQHKRAMRGIENALNAGIGTIIFTAACKSLLPELPVFANALYDRFPSIRHICVIPLMNTMDTDFPLSDELLEPKDFIRLIRGISLLNVLGLRIDVLNEPLAYVAANALERPLSQWSQPLNHEESLIVMADGRIKPAHFSNTHFGQYKAGMLQKVLASDEYRKAVAGDDKICPSCEYHSLCIRHGMTQPSESTKYSRKQTYYCRSVLKNI